MKKEEVGERSVKEALATNEGDSALPTPSDPGAAVPTSTAGSATNQETAETTPAQILVFRKKKRRVLLWRSVLLPPLEEDQGFP